MICDHCHSLKEAYDCPKCVSGYGGFIVKFSGCWCELLEHEAECRGRA